MARRAGDVAWGMASGGVGLVIWFTVALTARADTLNNALINAYQNNPQLNSQRAVVRATDESVPQALSGYKPTATATLQTGQAYTSTVSKNATTESVKVDGTTIRGVPTGGFGYPRVGFGSSPSSANLTISQTLFNGFQTANRVRQAESNTSAARETLRVAEQTILLNAATAYMGLMRDSALLQLQQFNACVAPQVTVAIFNAGPTGATDPCSSIRAAKETVGQERMGLDTARDQVQASVVTAWGQLESAKAQILATQAQVASAEIALNGVREENHVGHRTSLHVLNSQQDLMNARPAWVTA